MRIFLSLGMRGRDEKDVLHDIEEATFYIKRIYPNCEVVNTYRQEGVPEIVAPTYYLGRSIQILGSCDQVWFLNDWKNYRGCLIEHEVCKAYGIPCYIADLRTVELQSIEALGIQKPRRHTIYSRYSSKP